jgi:hypothetical protein
METKIFNTAAVIILLVINPDYLLYAQRNETTKNSHIISLGYAYKTDAKWWREAFDKTLFETPKKTDDISVRYEFGFKNNLKIGIETLLIDDFKDRGMFDFSEGFSYEIYAVRFLPTVSYNFILSNRISLYTSLATGCYYLKTKVVHTYPTNQNSMGLWGPIMADEVILNKKEIGFDWAAAAGVNFFVTKNIGLFSEIGLNKSIFQAGIIVNTGK